VLQSSARASLRALCLRCCGVDAAGAGALAALLAAGGPPAALRELDLSFNCVRAAGAELLAGALVTNSTLTSLNLRLRLMT
jgi:hypothetical protein